MKTLACLLVAVEMAVLTTFARLRGAPRVARKIEQACESDLRALATPPPSPLMSDGFLPAVVLLGITGGLLFQAILDLIVAAHP